MSQGKLNGSNPGGTPGMTNNTGFSPTPNQSTIGQFGNTFGQVGPVGSPGGFGSKVATDFTQAAAPGTGTDFTRLAQAQPVQPQPIQPTQEPPAYVSGGMSDMIGPVSPMDDGMITAQAHSGATHDQEPGPGLFGTQQAPGQLDPGSFQFEQYPGGY